MIGTFLEKDISSYQPSEPVRNLTKDIQKDFQHGWDLQHRSYREFNDMSLLSRMDRDQKRFGLYVEPISNDPDKVWREQGVRPITRNKVISMAAHLITAMMYPNVSARNEEEEPEQEAAQVMRKMALWNMDNSDYDMTMLFGIISACINPCAYVSVEYTEAIQKIRERMENGDVKIIDAVDDIFSGIQFNNIPVEEVLISNFYQRNHQKQRFVIRRRLIDYSEAEGLYQNNDNFQFVKPGVKRIFGADTDKFYDLEDSHNPTLVEEITYFNRTEDTEIPYLNGVYVGDENVENNPFIARTHNNKPRYSEAKFGYEPISENFYYFKSAADKLDNDQTRLDKMHRMTMDGTYLSIIKPLFTSGGAVVNSSVVFPGAVTDFPKDTTITPYETGANLRAGYEAMRDAEQSISESSQDAIRGGTTPQGDRTAFEISRVEFNAVIKEFGIFGRMVGNAVEKVGEFLVDDILRYQTLGEVDETVGPGLRMKFRSFLLENQIEEGKSIDEKIVFTDEFMGRKFTDEELKSESFKLLRRGGVKKSLDDLHTKIYLVNPLKFRRLSYKIDIEPDQLLPKSMISEENRKLRFYGMMMNDPNADQEAVARDFLFEVAAKGQSDKYMRKAEQAGLIPQVQGQQPQVSPDEFLPAQRPNNLPLKV